MDVVKRNAIKITGTGEQVILLATGYGTDQRIWRRLVPHFEKDYKLVMFDYVGAGESDPSCYSKERYATLEGYSQDIIEILEFLDLRNVIFIGHSVSCIIGLLAAIQRPDYISKLIFLAPSPCYINDTASSYKGGFDRETLDSIVEDIKSNYVKWANDVIPTVVNNADKPELIQEILAMFMSYDEDIARAFAISTFFCDHRKDLLKLNKSCLILQATQDLMAPLHVGDYLHAHLQKSTLKVLKARGHFPQLTDPDEVNALIADYLKRD